MINLIELRKTKRSYTKEYSEKPTLVLNLKNYPEVDLIVTHGDGKSWATFIRSNEAGVSRVINLGRGNSIATGILTASSKFSYDEVESCVVLSDNELVTSLYTDILKQLVQHKCYYYNSFYITKELVSLLKINPNLYLNLNECCAQELKDSVNNHYTSAYKSAYWNKLSAFEFTNIGNPMIDYRKPLIKSAFGVSAKYIRAAIKTNLHLKTVIELKNHNYSAEEIILYKAAFDEYSGVGSNNYSDRNKVLYFCSIPKKGTYTDYLRIIDTFPNELKKQFPITPDKNHIEKWHNKAVDVSIKYRERLQNLKNEELNKNYVNNFYNIAKSFEFKDDSFSIIACKNISELVKEGSCLRHCVGSYINSVSCGKEYILFLRKNECIDTPFFTIDVTPDNRVRQIHGLCNCNITKEIRPFIEKWAKKFKLDISNCSGVYCAIR